MSLPKEVPLEPSSEASPGCDATSRIDGERTVTEAFHSATLRLDRIVEQLQGIHVSLESMRVSLSGLSRTAEDHEVRLRRLESWSQRLTPLVSLVTFVAGAIATAFIGGLLG